MVFIRRNVFHCDFARFEHQSLDVSSPVLATVGMYDALHRRVGFKGRAVDTDRMTVDQFALHRELEEIGEDFRRQPLTNDRERGVVGRAFMQRRPQEFPQRQAVGTSPGDAPLGIDPLEVTH